MIRWRTIAMVLALLAGAGCADRQAGDPARPEGYDLRLAVSPAPGGLLQRIDVPAQALAALRSSSRSDLRLFDATGTALPMAVLPPTEKPDELRSVRLDALPILGPAGGRRTGDATLSIEDRVGGRIVRLTRADGAAADGTTLLGVLLDARRLADPVRSLRLDGRWPAQQPISFRVEASTDLREWTALGSRTVYRPSAAAGVAADEAIQLNDADLRGRWLRVSWSSADRLLGPVEIDGATLVTARPISDLLRAIPIVPPPLVTAHELRFGFAHPVAPAAMRIEPAGGEMLVRVAVAGRNAPDQGWRPLGSGLLRAGRIEPVMMKGPPLSEYRIEADRRTAGFAVPPRVQLLFAPTSLAILLSGKPPYLLAAGAVGAESRYLPLADLLPGAGDQAIAALPLARVERGPPEAGLAVRPAGDGRIDSRALLLWSLLLFGVAALAVMVWRLWRPAPASNERSEADRDRSVE